LDWDVGALWRRDREAGVLRCVEIWSKQSVDVRNFAAASRAATFEPGIGLPGRLWFNREPFYIPDIVRYANFLRAPIVDREVLHARGVGLPHPAFRRCPGRDGVLQSRDPAADLPYGAIFQFSLVMDFGAAAEGQLARVSGAVP